MANIMKLYASPRGISIANVITKVIFILRSLIMKNIGIIYSSKSHSAEKIAYLMGRKLTPPYYVDIKKVSQINPNDMSKYDLIILGASTINPDKIEPHWKNFVDKMKEINLKGKKIAFFGVGDQLDYPDHFADSIGNLWKELKATKAELYGKTSTDGYDFKLSKAVENGKFIGLVLDEDNQPEETSERINNWVNRIKTELH